MRAILTFHSIDDSGSPISVTRSTFAQQVAWLANGRVRVLPLRELVRDRAHDDDAVALTFDDGFDNFRTDAWPLLKEYGLPATVFVVSRHVGATNAWRGVEVPGIPTLPLMSWSALETLAGEGLDVGAHTRTHVWLSRLSEDEARDELAGCSEDIHARLGVRPDSFAYPYGDAPLAAQRLARHVFTCACTTEYRPLDVSDSIEALPRLDMYYFQEPGALEGWGRPAFRARITARRTARAVRSALRSTGGA